MIGFDVHAGKVNHVAIGNAMKKGSIKALSRAGAYMRGAARRRVRHSKFKSSLPGQSPRDHTGFKRTFLFAVDKGKQSVYVGPQRWIGKKRNAGRTQANTLEFGGSSNSSTLWFSRNPPKTETLDGVKEWVLQRGWVRSSWGDPV